MESAYTYEPLPTIKSIRVLTLYPGVPGDPLSGSLNVSSLDDSETPFKALSYTWSNPLREGNRYYEQYDTEKHYIMCDGKRLAIKENLRDALWNIRSTKYSERIWIDALCINQNNLSDEKATQIALMNEVYSKAKEVVIWLGRSDPTSDRAIDFIEKHGKTVYCVALENSDVSTIKRFMDFFDKQSWSALINLLQRTWFSRVWTFQEACLPRNTIALCGARYFSDLEIAAILPATLFKARRFSLNLTLDIGIGQDEEAVVENLLAAAILPAWWGTNWDASGFGTRAFLRYPEIDMKLKVPYKYKWLVALEVLIHEMRQRECSEAKDKIIAPLAFAKSFLRSIDYEELRNDLNRLLDPSMSQNELFIEFTRFMMTAMGNFDILSRADRYGHFNLESSCQLPSWVPNFSLAGTTSLIDDILYTKYDAARNLTGQVKPQVLLSRKRELRVDATYFENIRYLSRIWIRADRLGEWFTLAENCEKTGYFHTGDKNFVCGSVFGSPGDNDTESTSDLFYQVRSGYSGRIKDLCRREKEAEAARLENLRIYMSTLVILQLNIQNVRKTCRRLFCSSGQRNDPPVLGLAPIDAKEGDRIYILKGARVPFVLRKVDGENFFQVIGETYVDTIMHGQVGQKTTLGKATEEIVLV